MSEDTTAEKIKKYIVDDNAEYHDNIFIDAIDTYKNEIVETSICGVFDKGESQGVFYIFKDCSAIGCFADCLTVASASMVLEGYKRQVLKERTEIQHKHRVKHDG